MKVLNVGGGSKQISIPPIYSSWQHYLLDIADGPDVDIVMDTRDMNFEDEFDAVHCSHNLEHYPAHDVSLVLSKFRKALKVGGHVNIAVPDLTAVFKILVDNECDLDLHMYLSPSGPISAKDMIYGLGREVEASGDAWGHKTGFTVSSLRRELERAGFENIEIQIDGFNLQAIAWKEHEDVLLKRLITSPTIKPVSGTVMLGYAHNGNMRHEFHRAISNLGGYDAKNNKRILGELSAGGPYITENRNMLCDQMLRSPAEWLLMLDNDVEFPSDILDRLLELADPETCPVIGALYFTQINGYWMPVWLEEMKDVGLVPVEQITIGEVREIDSIGMGCTLIHRSVLEAMKEKYSDDPWPWFNHDFVNGGRAGEDVTFCYRLKSMGIKIHGFAFPLVHMKTYPIDWQIFNDQYRLAALNYSEKEK